MPNYRCVHARESTHLQPRAGGCLIFFYQGSGTRESDVKYMYVILMKSVFPFFLSAANSFPYVKKRIQVIDEENFELTPIEVSG